MAIKIQIHRYGHCSLCYVYEATTTGSDGLERSAESREGRQGSEDEAIGRRGPVTQSPSPVFERTRKTGEGPFINFSFLTLNF